MKAGPKTAPAPNRASEVRAAEVAAFEHDQRAAARVIAARATDSDDCRCLLEMLGLNRAVGLPEVDPPARL